MILEPSPLQKVTCFITRQVQAVCELLLIRHPYAGFQLPAGTVEPGETAEAAALRETQEETGLAAGLEIPRKLHQTIESYPGQSALTQSTTAFSRPDPLSWGWLNLPRAIWLNEIQSINGYTQIRYDEPDQIPDTTYNTFAFTAWVPSVLLTKHQIRHFFLLNFTGSTASSWEIFADQHNFQVAWFPVASLPPLIESQQKTWLPIYLNAVADKKQLRG